MTEPTETGTNPTIHDVIVVGGGAAGAYAAWRLRTGAAGSGSLLPSSPSARDILLVEASDRIGGRLESLAPPGAPNLRAEFGGMGFTTANTYVNKVIDHFGLASEPFPRGDGNNLLYLRAKQFPKSDVAHPQLVPYHLDPTEQGKNPMQLVSDAVTGVFGQQSMHWTTAQWRSHLSTFTWLGQPIGDIGWWNFLSTVMSHEAFVFATQGMGHFFQLSNWNCAEAIPWFMGDGAAAYKTLTDGYDAIPRTLAEAFQHVGGQVSMQTPVTGVSESAGVLSVETSSGTLLARRVVLAMPRRALELIAPNTVVLSDPAHQADLESVTGQKVMKIFLTYDRPWWQLLNITNGSSATDLPLGNVWYFGPDSASNDNSLLMASYNDTLATNYWEGLEGGPSYPDQPNPRVTHYDPTSTWGKQAASQTMVDEVQRQLREMHQLTVNQLPQPYSSAYRDWSVDPYGGAFYTWNVGIDAGAVMQRMIQPDPAVPLHIIGSAYSRDQGWVEGALHTAELLMTGVLGLLDAEKAVPS